MAKARIPRMRVAVRALSRVVTGMARVCHGSDLQKHQYSSRLSRCHGSWRGRGAGGAGNQKTEVGGQRSEVRVKELGRARDPAGELKQIKPNWTKLNQNRRGEGREDRGQ